MSSRLKPKPICVRSLVPNEKNSAVLAIRSASSARAGNLDHRAVEVRRPSMPVACCDLGVDAVDDHLR